MLKIRTKGKLNNTHKFLNKASKQDFFQCLDVYGAKGVQALSNSTPVDTGYTASCWKYKIHEYKHHIALEWYNTNVVNGCPIAIVLQYGHGTRNGGYVEGIDYINPALKPIFDEIADSVWKELIRT